jgi:hypothetical protein
MAAISRTAFELQTLLRKEPQRCSICRFVDGAMAQYIDLLFFERVTDVETRDGIRRAGGFCRYHARRISQQADALGTAIIMKDLLINDLRALDGGVYDRAAGGRFTRLFDGGGLPERAPCPLCVHEAEVEVLTIDRLLEGLSDHDFAADFRRSDGLCMPHFRLAFTRGRENPRWSEVVETERSGLERLASTLDELARKFDHRFRHETRPEEESGSWRRALDMTSKAVDS